MYVFTWFDTTSSGGEGSRAGRYAELRKIWSPEKPGKQKVLAFQYGKAAAERNRDGLPASQDGSIQIILGVFLLNPKPQHPQHFKPQHPRHFKPHRLPAQPSWKA